MATTTIKPFFTPNPSSSSYSNDYSDSETDDFDMGGPPVSMQPRPSASKATLYRKRQPGSNAKADNVLVTESLPTRMINNPAISLPSYYDIDQDVLDFKDTQVLSQGHPASSTPHIFEEEESSFTSSTASRHTLFQTVYEKWQNDDEARLDVVPEIDGRHTSASSRTSSSIYEQYQQDLTRIGLNSGINIGSLIPDKNFHSQTALYGQPNNLSAELTRSEVMTTPLSTRVKHQGRERLHEQGRTTFEVVEEEDEEYNYKYNINDDNYHRKNSNDETYSSPVSASVHPFFQQPPPLAAMPFPVHSNFSMNNTAHNILTTSPRHANPSPFLDDAKRSQILEWKKHTSPPEAHDSSSARTISRAVPDYTAPASTGNDELFDSPLSSYGPQPQRPREMSYDSTSTVHAGLHVLERRRSQADGLLARGAGRPILRDEERFPYRVAPEGDKVSGESESDVNDDELAVQAEAVASMDKFPIGASTLTVPGSQDDATLHTIRDSSVCLDSGDDDSSRGERVVAFRIKDGNVKQATTRFSRTPKKSRSSSRSLKSSNVPTVSTEPSLASSATSSLPMVSVSVAVPIPPRIVEKNDGPEGPLDSESRMVPLRDNEDVSVCGDGRRGSRLIDFELLDLLNRYEVLKMEMTEMKAAVNNLTRLHRADVRGHLVRTDQRFVDFRTEPHPISTAAFAAPISRISKPLPPFASRFMSVEQLRLQCARVGRTNSSSLATANPGAFFVTNFQAHARGFIIRKLVDTFWVHYIAASRIQAAWRGYKTRNYMAPALSLRILRRIQRRSQGADARFTHLELRMDEEEVRMEEMVDEIRLLRQLEDRVQEEVDLRQGYEKKIGSSAIEIKELRQRVREESELRKDLQERLEEAQADMIESRALKQLVLKEADHRRALEKRLDEAVEEMQMSSQRIAAETEQRKGLECKLQEVLKDLSASKELEQRIKEEAESRRVLEQRLDQALNEMRATKELEQRVAIEEKARKGLEKKLEEAFAEIRALKTNTPIKPPTATSSHVSSMKASIGPAQVTVNSPSRATRAHVPVNTAPVAARPIGRREEKLAVLGRVNSPINIKSPLVRN